MGIKPVKELATKSGLQRFKVTATAVRAAIRLQTPRTNKPGTSRQEMGRFNVYSSPYRQGYIGSPIF